MAFYIKTLIPILLLGAAAGFLNGLLGTGGGIPLVLGLHLLLGKRVANSKRFFTTALAVMLPLSLYSIGKYRVASPLSHDVFLFTSLPAALGGIVGALLFSRLSTRALGRIFATVVLISGILVVI